MNLVRLPASAFWLCLLLGMAPSLVDHLQRMWRLEQYHYLPALFLAVFLLVWQRWDGRWSWPRGGWSWGVLSCGGLLAIFSFLSGSSWIGAAAFLFFLGGWLLSHRQQEPSASLVGLWPPCWLLLPLPLSLDTSLTSWLQLWSSRLSSFSLDFLRVPHALFGNVLELEGGKLFVEEACSGVQSLYTVIFASVLLVSVFRRSLWLLPGYVLAAIFWAGIMNVVRIVVIAYARDRYALDLAHGWQHALLGYFCLALAIVFLLSTDRLLRVLGFPIEPNAAREAETNPFVYAWNRLMWVEQPIAAATTDVPTAAPAMKEIGTKRLVASYSLAALTLLIGAGQAWRLMPRSDAPSIASGADGEPFLLTSVQLASGMEGFQVQEHGVVVGDIGQPMGRHADVWTGDFKGTPIKLALSQPYPEWHDLCVCYTGIGLKMNQRLVEQPESGEAWNYVAARLVGDDGRVTYVWFSAFDQAGNPVFAPDSGFLTRWMTRLQAGDSLLSGSPEASQVAIVQLVVEADDFLPPHRIADLEQFHLDSRELLKDKTTAPAPAHPAS